MRKIIFIIFLYLISSFSLFSQWSEQTINPTPPRLNCVAADAPGGYFNQVGWIGGDSGTILFTSNSGTNWLYRNNPVIGSLNINVITILPQQYYYPPIYQALCSATSPTTTYIYRTTNQGLNWNIVYQQQNGRIRSISMFDTSIGYAIGDPVGGRWTILKTTNKGLTFDSSGLYLTQSGSEISNYNSFNINRSVYNDSSYFLLGTNNFKLYRSLNRGLNWTSIILPYQNVYSIHFAEAPNNLLRGREWGYAMGNSSLYSTNFGLTWIGITPPGTGDIHGVHCDDNSYSCYIRGSQIYASTNSTTNFFLQYTSPNGGNYTAISLKVFVFEGGSRNGWAIKDNGTVSKYLLSWSGLRKIGNETPNSFSLSQNYPNPFNPTTKIQYAIIKNSHVDLQIFDATGHKITQLVNEQQTPGTYETEFDGSSYASGVYFYQLTVNDFASAGAKDATGPLSITKRMVMIK